MLLDFSTCAEFVKRTFCHTWKYVNLYRKKYINIDIDNAYLYLEGEYTLHRASRFLHLDRICEKYILSCVEICTPRKY